MLVKSVIKDGLEVQMFKNEMIFGEAYTVMCEGFIKSYQSFYEANKTFDMLVSEGGLWH